MSTSVVFNGVTYSVPASGDSGWADNVSNYLIAIASGALQKTGGTFALAAEVDFGATYGLKSAYFKSRGTNPAAAGVLRLANLESVSWRNAANSADLALKANASDQLEFGGTKVTLSGAIVNADISASAAIELSKLAALTVDRVLVSSGVGVVSASSVSATTLGYLDATSSVQTQLNGKEPTITTLLIAKGGTNSGTALTNDKVMVSNSGAIVESTITTTLLGYLANLTGEIQTQLNGKEPTITTLSIAKGGTNSGTALTNSKVMVSSAGAIVESSTSTTTLGYLDATSSVQTQLNAKAPLISPSFTTPDIGAATGASLVVAASSPTLNASAILQADSTTKGFLPPRMTQAQRDAISTPATGLQIYNTDTNKLNVYNGSAWGEVGSGSSGINYITDTDGSVLGSWVTYNDGGATPSQPIDGTGGSPTVTFATSSSSAMRGTSNFLFTHAASNQQGQGFSYTMAIDPSDRGKVLQLSFEYLVASGTYADNDLSIWFYDVTNSALIQPWPYLIKNSSLIEKFASEVQIPSSCASLRLIVHVTSSTATAYTMRFENWSFGPQAKFYGSPITDFQTQTGVTCNLTNTTVTAKSSKQGDLMEFDVLLTATGSAAGSTIDITIPYTIDTAKFVGTTANTRIVGYGYGEDAGVAAYGPYFVNVLNSTTVRVRYTNGTSTASDATASAPFTFATGDVLNIRFRVPITGWSSSVVMSSDAATNVVSASYTGTNDTSVAASATETITFNTKVVDTHGAFNTTTGEYTAKVPGVYKIFAQVAVSDAGGPGVGRRILIKKDGSTVFAGLHDNNTGSSTLGISTSGIVELVAGSVIRVDYNNGYASGAATIVNSTYTIFTIERISGPAQIAASETVAARYTNTTGAAIADADNTVLDFPTKDYDYTNSVTTGANWKFTAPISGLYEVVVNVNTAANASINTIVGRIRKNGTAVTSKVATREVASSSYLGITSTAKIRLLAGEYIDYVFYEVANGQSLDTGSGSPSIEIMRVGNY